MTDEGLKNLEEPEQISLAEFLESIPPGSYKDVLDIAKTIKWGNGTVSFRFSSPDIKLHCSHVDCNGSRFYRCESKDVDIADDKKSNIFVRYVCSNCRSSEKVYSLSVILNPNSLHGKCIKYGEDPGFGPEIPSRLMKMIGPERDLFLKGRRCENQGLGVGAFVYYRRVVESQKNRILDEILKVSRKLNSPASAIAKLEAAKKESRFSQALKDVKDAVPQALLINGLNPLLLLHSALSDGLHDRTDEYCLEVAASVRVVLGELAERLSQALKDEAELTRALARLATPMNISESRGN